MLAPESHGEIGATQKRLLRQILVQAFASSMR
jgi:hypothetical protein